jgi:dTDP-4-dehydrorhamnose 3,5-epimerase
VSDQVVPERKAPEPATRHDSALSGVSYGSMPRIEDVRGSFAELWRASQVHVGRAFVQANMSTSEAGVLRGLHCHRRQTDLWIVAAGRAFVALVDTRQAAAEPGTRARFETRDLGAGDWVVIPAGVAHGFLALDRLELVYLVTNEYDGTDELGFAWDDPEVAVPWPPVPGSADGDPILSERDRSNPPLHDLLVRLRDEDG